MRCIVLYVLLTGALAQEAKVVNINQGPVRGYKDPELDIVAYYGIPYATMPKGRERFKAPLPPPTWTEPFEAVNAAIVCPQQPTEYIPIAHTEDCLVANVYVPNTNESNLPVLVGVHGGGFQWGYSTLESPRELVNHKKNVIAVNFNYRLGAHGFLCLGTDEVPGNAGMKDQVALLRWVRDNIAYFGGNPDDVTIHGCSAGGTSVDLLMLSKMATGLFKKVIGTSGASVSVFAVQMDPTENAREYAKRINYDGEDTLEALEEFYKTVPIEKLNSLSNEEKIDASVTFSACIERDLGIERFLDESPTKIISSGNYVKYPLMYGYSAMEGLFRMNMYEEWKVKMNEDLASFLPADLIFESEEQRQAVTSSIRDFYFPNQTVNNESIQGYIDFHSDALFVNGINRGLSLHVNAGNDEIYLQVVSFTDDNTPITPQSGERGATHCTQALLVLDPLDPAANLTSEYLEMSSTLRELWLNFVITGHPTPPGQTPASVPYWKPAGVNRSPCMHFNSTIELIGQFAKPRQDLWDDIYDRFLRIPIAPYDFPSSSVNVKCNSLFLGLVLFFSLLKNMFYHPS